MSELSVRYSGGVSRWHLDGRPISTGVGLELEVMEFGGYCDPCDGEGSRDGDGGRACPDCGGAGQVHNRRWVRVRWELSGGRPRLHLRTSGADLVAEVPSGARLRWP